MVGTLRCAAPNRSGGGGGEGGGSDDGKNFFARPARREKARHTPQTSYTFETHGHATNPAFEETVLHVFVEKSDREFFTRTKSNRNVPQVCIDLTILPDAFSANIPLARPGRCQSPLKDLPEERVGGVLDAAAQ